MPVLPHIHRIDGFFCRRLFQEEIKTLEGTVCLLSKNVEKEENMRIWLWTMSNCADFCANTLPPKKT